MAASRASGTRAPAEPAETARQERAEGELAGQEPAGHEPTGHEPTGHESAGHESAGHEFMAPEEWASWLALLQLQQMVLAELDTQLRHRHGLAVTEFDVLITLFNAPGQRLQMSALARQVMLSPADQSVPFQPGRGSSRPAQVVHRPHHRRGHDAAGGPAHAQRRAPAHLPGADLGGRPAHAGAPLATAVAGAGGRPVMAAGVLGPAYLGWAGYCPAWRRACLAYRQP